jgi:hypothetical protein
MSRWALVPFIPSPRLPTGNHTGPGTRKGALRAASGPVALARTHPGAVVTDRRGDGMS